MNIWPLDDGDNDVMMVMLLLLLYCTPATGKGVEGYATFGWHA